MSKRHTKKLLGGLTLVLVGFLVGLAWNTPLWGPNQAPAEQDASVETRTGTQVGLPTSGGLGLRRDDDGAATEVQIRIPDLRFDVAAEDDDGTQVADGDDWEQLPRNDSNVLWQLVRKPRSVEPRELYRNVLLNPFDIHIPARQRRLFEGCFRRYRNDLDAIYLEVVRRRSNELRELVGSGSLPEMSWDAVDSDMRESLRYKARVLQKAQSGGIDDGYLYDLAVISEYLRDQGHRSFNLGGRVYYIPATVQLRSEVLSDVYADAVHVFVFGVISWFDSCGAIQPDSRTRLSNKLDANIARLRTL